MQDHPRQVAEVDQIDPGAALPAVFYARPVVEVAQALLGCLVVSQLGGVTTAGIIVETEAYGGPDDPASHAAFRQNGVVQAMWGPPGHAYVYRAYGIYPCFNVVTGEEGHAAAVLVRALEPVVGLPAMAKRRSVNADLRMTNGPGKLALALGISIADNGRSLTSPPLWIQPHRPATDVVSGHRIGIRRGTDRHWRFGIAGHPSLSRRFPPES